VVGAGIYRFPYRELTRLASLLHAYWPEMSGRFFGNTGKQLRRAEASDALCFAYAYFLSVTEFRDEARKSLEGILTMDLADIVTGSISDNRPVSEIAVSMSSDWDAFEAELGLTRGAEQVE